MGEVEWKLLQPDGNYPAFGDGFNVGPHLRERARSVAALLGIPEAKHLAQTTDPGGEPAGGEMLIESLNYPSVGEDLRTAYEALPRAGRRRRWTPACRRQGTTRCGRTGRPGATMPRWRPSPRGTLITSHGHSAIILT